MDRLKKDFPSSKLKDIKNESKKNGIKNILEWSSHELYVENDDWKINYHYIKNPNFYN